MTVNEAPGEMLRFGDPRTTYLCEWFRGAAHLRGTFVEHLLEKFTPPAKR